MNESEAQSKIDGIALIGFRINPGSETPEFYTLSTYGSDVDTVLTVNNDLAFFSKPEQTKEAFKLFSKEIRRNFPVPNELDLVVDMAATLFLIESEIFDDSAVILNCLNTIFDLLRSANIQLLEERKTLLWKFADHLTFDKEFGQYLTSSSISRKSIIDALTWCVGAIVTRSRILFT